MAKYILPAVLDLALQYIKSNCSHMVACSAQPANFSDVSTYGLASQAMASGDFTLANGDTSGRKVTVAAKAGIAVTTSGTVTHVALVNDTGTELLLVTTTPSTPVASGGTLDLGSWKEEIQSPT